MTDTNIDAIVKGLLFRYSFTSSKPITKRQIFDYLRSHNYNVSLLNEVLHKLYIKMHSLLQKEKNMRKNEIKTRKDVEKRLDEWLTREYYRPPQVDGGPGYYETLNNFTNFSLSFQDIENKRV
tara:strand:- start:236 stop:604 length:369 start_codon:yes stop_codon:yes gene_type:complete